MCGSELKQGDEAAHTGAALHKLSEPKRSDQGVYMGAVAGVCVCVSGLGSRLESKVSMWRKSCRVLQPKVNEEGVHDGLHLGRGSQSLRKRKKADVGCHRLEGEEGIHARE